MAWGIGLGAWSKELRIKALSEHENLVNRVSFRFDTNSYLM
jgi:hypothetical protein